MSAPRRVPVLQSRLRFAAQRGSILVATAGALLVSIVLLASADLGYLFYMKRELQKVADLAALAGAQRIEGANCVSAAPPAAIGNANVNLSRFSMSISEANNAVTCGRWDPTMDPASTTIGTEEAPNEGYAGVGVRKYFGTPKDKDKYPDNAVKVAFSQSVPTLLGLLGSRVISVEAIAMHDAPVAAFSVGSRMVRLQSKGLLYNVLTTVGLKPEQVDILSSKGLANVTLTPAGLLDALGLPITAMLDVGTANEAAALKNLTLGGLLQASIDALSATGVASAQVTVLKDLKLQLSALTPANPLDLPIRLFGTASDPGVFAHITAPDGISALNAKVNVLDLIGTSISVANGTNLIEVPDLNVAGLVRGKIRIVEPPTIAIGGVGAQASSAQVRVYLRVSTSGVPLVGGLLDALGTKVDLPIIIEVAQSTGTLTNLCAAPLAPREADIAVTSSVVNLCLGEFPGMGTPLQDDFFSSTSSCTTLVKKHKILDVLGLLPLSSSLAIPVLDSGTTTVRATAPEAPNPPEIKTVSPVDNVDLTKLGHTLASQIGNGLLGDLLGARDATGLSGASADATTTQMAKNLLGPAPGRSLGDISGELTWSTTALEQFRQTWANGQILLGLTQLVGKLLGSVGAVLGDVTCNLAGIGGPAAAYECKLPIVKGMVNGDSAVTAILGLVVQVLTPVLDGLSALLQSVLNNLLGLGIGETDVSLLSVDCGNARLVY